MATLFKINLIRGLAPSPERRRRLYSLMIAYFLATGGATVAVLGHHARLAVRLWSANRVVDAQERWFRRQYPAFGRLSEFADDLRMGLSVCRDQLTAVQQVIRRRTDLSPLMAALLEPMSPGMRLLSFSMDREKKTINFEVAFPTWLFERRSRGEVDILAAWNGNPLLKTRLRSIALTGTHRARGPTGFEYVLTFSGLLSEGRGEGGP